MKIKILAAIVLMFLLTGCDLLFSEQYFILNKDLPLFLEVGDELPDFKEYVTIMDNGEEIPLTDDMIDSSRATTGHKGTFLVIYTYQKGESKFTKFLSFSVVESKKPIITQAITNTRLGIGQTVDFKDYIEATDYLGVALAITDEMVDASAADLSKPGTFTVIYHVADVEGRIADFSVDFEVCDFTPTVTQVIADTELVLGSPEPDFKIYIEAKDYLNNDIIITDAMVDSAEANLNSTGEFTVRYHVTDDEGHTKDFDIIFTVVMTGKLFKAENYETLKDQHNISLLNSIGEAKVLVLTIDFPNDAGTATELQQLQKAFFGTSDEVEYESVKSYYAKSSFGLMNLTGSVMPWYRAEHNFQYYANLYDNYNQDSDQSLIKDALNYHITNNGLDLEDYDLNDDGYVDSIWAIYSAPVDYTSDSIIWWAYQYNFSDLSTIDGKRLDLYAWASVDFMKEDRELTNARTYIHETGHLLGLDDYYDYDATVGAKGGLGGADMMDYNSGDHNSFSKMVLGWVNPYLINGNTVTVDLKSCSDTGEVILIPVKWEQSIFTEYYLIEFYTPTSLNSENDYLTTSGIRILHVIASIGPLGASGAYETIYNYDNTDTNYKLITMARASGSAPFGESDYASNTDLFKVGTAKSFKAYNQTEMFTITVNAFSSSSANISITLAQ